MNNLHFAPMIIAYRMINLAMLTVDPSPRRIGEARRMTTEKNDAMWAGMAGAQMAAYRAGWTLWGDLMMGRSLAHGIGVAVDKVQKASLAPANRQLGSNGRRLSRARRF